MYSFGTRSLQRLGECHPKLQEIMHELIKTMDVAILCGYRGEIEQNQAFVGGKSKLEYPKSKHNQKPSLAVDVAPWPIDWNNIHEFERMCGIIEGIAQSKGINIRLGRDFSFKDYPHVELLED
jgi:peptidoglycan L-alanyl-D-glutamate endopeptidase CwlK